MKALAIILCVALGGAALVQAQADPCSQWPTCQTCVSHNLCGWCSLPVVYQGNVTGKQCAGFNPNGPDPFACNGIYSTDQCVQGYVCNKVNYTCELAPPGSGYTKKECEAECYNHGHTYLCNHTTKKCHEVPPGTPGASSMAVCEAACSHPHPHPVPPPPPATPAMTYACNYTEGKCNPTSAGHGSSLPVCEQSCRREHGKQYICNSFLQKCVEVSPGTPGGESKEKCELKCDTHPKPGPPPSFLGGMWRGIEIQNGYKIGEWDVDVTEKLVTMINVQAAVTIKGIPSNVAHADMLQLWINVTSGPGLGQVIKAIGVPYNRGPETNYLQAAFSKPGGDAPSDIDSAVKNGDLVLALIQCAGTPECVFTMPSGAIHRRTPKVNRPRAMKIDSVGAEEEVAGPANDPCSQWAANCSFCLSHKFCGWCSEKVTYKGGETGTQCAGFSSNPNASNPFVCKGRYSTLACTVGYDCTSNKTCVPSPVAGNGMPLSVCKQVCIPTTTPPPTPPQYVCNLTDHKCYHCNTTHCPGSMPKGTCEASCVHPHHGPTSLVKGFWRGLKIEQGYPLVEYEMLYNSSKMTFYKMGQAEWSAEVTSFGGDLMVLKVTDGPLAGKTLSGLYSVNDQNGLYAEMTIAFSAPDAPVPNGYAGPMTKPNEFEMVLTKCNKSPCVFNPPA